MAEKKKVKNLIKFRDSHRNFVRKTIAEAKDLISGGNPIEVRKLKLLRTSLQTKCSELQVLDRDIVELLEDVSKIDSDVSESCELISVIQECMVDLESALTAQESLGKNQQSNSLESAGTAQGHLQAVHTHAKLPKLELKKFHGNPIEWYPFWESFESAVHKNSNLSGVDKFNYLKSLLTGIAQSVVTGLALTSANYEKAVELLKRRFGNRQVVISSHMKALTNIPKVASTSEVKRLRSLYDTVESHVRGLESMEISSEMYGCFLTPIIMKKLPEEFRIAISRNLESETWDLKEILSEFHKELQLREQCLVNPKDVRPSNSFQRGESLQSTSALYSESAKNKQFSRVWCSFCNQNHQSSKCNESRKQVLRKKGRCYLCLKSGHLSRNCKSPVKCFKCQGAHHVAICDSFEHTVSGPEQVENVPNVSTSLYVDQYRGSVLLQTATAEVVRPDNDSSPLNVRLVFDSCSQRSYVTQAVKEKLQLPVVGRDSLLIKTFGESDARLRTCEIVQVGIKTLCDTTVYIQAYVVPVICGPLTQQSTELTQSSYEHLRDLPLADRASGGVLAVSILVGADYYWSLVEGTLVRGAPREPVALATKLGFVLSGPTMVMCDNVHANTVNLTATHVLKVESSVINHDDLAAELKKFWDYESFGIHDDNATLYDKFVNEVEFVEGRYQVRLPFKEDHDLLPDNFALCKSRLVSLLRRLSVKPDVSRQYNDVILDQLKQGIIECVDQGTTNGVGKVHYIPHHEVILAISGDIEKAFLNISVDPRDRDYLRFLWVDDTGSKHPNLQVYRFARVAFGISSSPFLLNATIRHHLTSTDLPEEFVDCVLKSLYVDDFVGGEDSGDLVFETFKNLKSSFKSGGFNMRKWVSNSTLVQKRIEEHERESPLDVEISTKPVEECKIQEEDQTFSSSQFRAKGNPCSVRCKVLGIGWDTESDMFSLNLASPIETNNGCPITKRSILAATSKLYNPLGILSPVIILWKIIFQSVSFEGTLRVDSVFCWSDSQIALWWIWGVAEQFVQNRVVEISGNVKPDHWDYCPSENNPADICSRSSLASKLVANQLWWNGPEFLLKGKDTWPNLPVNPEVTSTEPDTWVQLKKESSSSQKKQRNSTILANVVADRVTSERKLNLDCIIPLKGFSSLQRLIRVTAYVLRSPHCTNLVINECHLKVLHNGVRETLTELRSCFWVVKGRQAVKTVIGKCSVCKKIEGRSYAVPHSPPLPEFRLSDEFAFSRVGVGVDFAGPVYVRDIFAKGGGMNKVYIALFTCISSRAVHLELVPSFIKALARFKGRRGTPTLIVSDNGKTFKDSRVQAYCQRDGTKWRFNVEAAPWWGGFFERLVKSVKLSLKKCLRNARLNYDELSTTLVEVEAVLNSRPLTYVYDEFEEPVTPSHLVIGRRILSMPSKNYSIDVPHTQQALSRRAKFLQIILNHFWNRWRAEYLTKL
ncbi:uncharacterized protein [Montipora capricornis]|uniref:uncharacterized protein n=1 Tax=Montipora capricornis TaxID=246305 RepID=UPI0035F1957D